MRVAWLRQGGFLRRSFQASGVYVALGAYSNDFAREDVSSAAMETQNVRVKMNAQKTNASSQMGGGSVCFVRLKVYQQGNAYAFMLTDSCAFSAFSSFILRAALLRCERSFMKDLAST